MGEYDGCGIMVQRALYDFTWIDKAFAKQRNSLNYSNQWPFDDLHAYYSPSQYCRFQNAPSLIERLDPDHQDFSVTLATSFFSNAASLLSSLASLISVDRR